MAFQSPSDAYYSQESDRLSFRELTIDDAKQWAVFFIDNPTQRFVAGDKLGSTPIEKATTWIDRQIKHKSEKRFGQLAVIEKNSGNFIGVGGIIYRYLDDQDEYEVTYSLLPSGWGKGLGTELAIHFKKYVSENIDTPSVISIIHKENEASMNVARKNGMSLSSESVYFEMPVYIFRTALK